MKKKLKWVVNIATLCLCACLAAIGVYAAKNASITAGGTISFNATNIFADVECEVLNAKTEITFNKITIDATKTDETFTDNTTWAKNLEFAEDGSDITLTFTITNKATDRALYAKITNTSNAENLSVKNGKNSFTETEWLELTEDNGGSTNETVLVITMGIANKDAAVSGNYGFNIQLESTKPVVEEDEIKDYESYEYLSFTPTDTTNHYMSVGKKGTPSGDIVIPSKVMKDGEPWTVTSMDSMTFMNCKEIESVELPDTITSIALAAFNGCSKLTSIKIPASVTGMGSSVFSGSGLTKIIIQDINAWAQINFSGPGDVFANSETKLYLESDPETPLTNIVLDSSVTSMNFAFAHYESLISIQLPENLTSISPMAFSGCSGLASIVIPARVNSIGSGAFNYCTALTTVYYKGTEVQWNAISIDNSNGLLNDATKVYNYQG